jgi:hypothetical protein
MARTSGRLDMRKGNPQMVPRTVSNRRDDQERRLLTSGAPGRMWHRSGLEDHYGLGEGLRPIGQALPDIAGRTAERSREARLDNWEHTLETKKVYSGMLVISLRPEFLERSAKQEAGGFHDYGPSCLPPQTSRSIWTLRPPYQALLPMSSCQDVSTLGDSSRPTIPLLAAHHRRQRC